VPDTRTSKKTGSGKAQTEHPPRAVEGDDARPIVCNVAFCPICMAVTSAQGAAPEAIEHLLKAARELFLAARAVVEVRGDHLEGEDGPKTAKLEKIEIV
jgi:hypothetical protein